jgi:hypothetical protein
VPGEGAEERVADGPLGAVVAADELVVLEELRQLLVPDQPRPPPRRRLRRARARHGRRRRVLPRAAARAAVPLRRGRRSHPTCARARAAWAGGCIWARAAPGVRARRGKAGARGEGRPRTRGLLVGGGGKSWRGRARAGVGLRLRGRGSSAGPGTWIFPLSRPHFIEGTCSLLLDALRPLGRRRRFISAVG